MIIANNGFLNKGCRGRNGKRNGEEKALKDIFIVILRIAASQKANLVSTNEVELQKQW